VRENVSAVLRTSAESAPDLLFGNRKMAQVPKVSAVLPVTTASATRGAPSVRVASVSAATVEEPHFSTAIQLDTAPFNFDEDRSRTDDRDPQQPQYHERRHLGLIEAPSQAFAALREYDNGTGRSAHGREGESRVFPGLVAKAINTYETNERVIHGNNPVLGTEVSVTL